MPVLPVTATDMFQFECAALSVGSTVLHFRGQEAISELYSFAIDLRIRDAAFEPQQLSGQAAALRIEGGSDGHKEVIHGMVASAEVMHAVERYAIVRVVLVPRLWQLSLSHHSRIFIDDDVVKIIRAILDNAGFSGDDYELRLSGSYPPLPHVCQYQESDYAFICRWMERVGMVFNFEHESGRDKLIISDHKSFIKPAPKTPVRYVPGAEDDMMADEALAAFNCRSSVLPKRVELQDYNHQKPQLDVVGRASISDKGQAEVCVYGENFDSPEAANQLATIRAEEYRCREKLYQGHGRVYGLRSGFSFTVEEHPLRSMNGEFLVITLGHSGNQASNDEELKQLLGITEDDEYQVHVTAIPREVQYRATRTTPRPRIYGMENAVIDGEADSPYAQIDEEGRYRVRINFDESDLEDGNASALVRMLQPHGGGNEGFHFPLRKGTEVLLTFQGGDPDRPMIAGVLPNAHKQSPINKDNHSKNIIQSGGMNLLEMEDLDGKQHMKMSSPTEGTKVQLGQPAEDDEHSANLQLFTTGSGNLYVGGGWSKMIVGSAAEQYHSSTQQNYFSTRTQLVKGDDIEQYLANYTRTIAETDKKEAKNIFHVASEEINLTAGQDIHLNAPEIVLSTGGAEIRLTGDKIIIAGDVVDVQGDSVIKLNSD